MAAYYPLFDGEEAAVKKIESSMAETAKKIESLEMGLQHTVQSLQEYTPCVYACADPPEGGYSSLEFRKVLFTSFSNNLMNGGFITSSGTVKAQITFFAINDSSKPLHAKIRYHDRLLSEFEYKSGTRVTLIIYPIQKDKEIKVYVKSADPKPVIYLKIEILQYL